VAKKSLYIGVRGLIDIVSALQLCNVILFLITLQRLPPKEQGMKFYQGLVVGTAILALSACNGFKSHKEIDALNEARAVGSPFTQQLAAEYRDFANSEQNTNFDYPDALHFARKGLAAASGEVVLPEPVSDWNLKAEDADALAAGRARLMAAFDAGAREIAPKEAAMAQGRYDCWIEAQEENNKPKEGQLSCRTAFEDVMSSLEGMVKPQPPAEVMAPVEPMAVDASKPMDVKDAVYLVFFDFDKSTLLPAGESVVQASVDEIKARSTLTAVNVVGHADAAGPKTYNKRLSLKRANAVKAELVKMGVDAKLIRVDHKGEEELMVPTPDGVREPANRRTVITFE
jgi:OmpA-OmpF porin, OOP family